MLLSASPIAQVALRALGTTWATPTLPAANLVSAWENLVVTALYREAAFGVENCDPADYTPIGAPERVDLPKIKVEQPLPVGRDAETIMEIAKILLPSDAGSRLTVLFNAHLYLHIKDHPVELFVTTLLGKPQLGVRAKRAIAAGTPLYCLAGFLSAGLVVSDDITHPSLVEIGPNQSSVVAGPARFLNSVCGKRKCTGCKCGANCWMIANSDQPSAKQYIFIQTKRNICPGEELLLYYGRSYTNAPDFICGRKEM